MDILSTTHADIQRAANLLGACCTVIHPTETCYGIACDLANRDAVQRVFDVKHRVPTQPLSALFASVDEAKKYVIWNDAADMLAKQHLPGPLTMILRGRSDAPTPLFVTPFPADHPCNHTIGVRISSHPIAMALARLCARPLSTTSANFSGKPSPYSIEEIRAQFDASTPKPDVVIDGGVLPFAPPSTVVDCSNGQVRVVREGNIRLNE